MRRFAALLAAFITCSAAQALPITYQGVLRSGGLPVNGAFSITFNLTDSPVGGFLLQSINIPNVNVQNGLFTVQLDYNDVHLNGDDRWLGIVVNGTSLSPRQKLTYAPYAIYTDRAREAGTVSVPLTLTGQTVVIEGFANASSGVGVRGVHLAATGTQPGILGQSNSTSSNAAGVLGEIVSTSGGGFASGVRGVNNSTGASGVGVYGSQDGSGWGVYGFTPDGRGVYGSTTTGTGVRGNSGPGIGVEGVTNGGIGVDASATSGVAVRAERAANDTFAELATADYGVHGTNLGTSGEGTAIRGTGGRVGVEGVAPGGNFGLDLTRIGVRGQAGDFTSGAMHFYGVHGSGQAPADGGGRFAYGVFGHAQSGSQSSTGYGVYGSIVGPGTNYAGYFQGNVHVAGTLTKSNGAFKIDHPLEPESKYLTHSFVESPEMLNIYSGTATLDSAGRITVELPRYFEALNTSFRYQLTAIGAPMRDLHIAAEVSGNAFEIAGGSPGGKVSWQVTGVRHDATARHHPIIVEEDKPEHHKGKYLEPEAHGADRSKAIHNSPSLSSTP